MDISIFYKKKYNQIKTLSKNFKIVKNGKICVAIGGDGTFIHAIKKYSCPILMIRDNDPSSTGYYADIGIDKLDIAVKKLLSDNYKVENIGKKLELSHKGKKFYAVNEAAIINKLGEISFKLYQIKNGKRKTLYPFVMSGDGAIITSQVGSTAYNRSAGGPIILDDKVMCITFLNPDGPYKNSMIVSSEDIIEIEIVKYSGYLRYDGIQVSEIGPGDIIRVKYSEKDIRIVKLDGIEEDFGDKLKRIMEKKLKKVK